MTLFLISLHNYNWLNHNGKTNKRMGSLFRTFADATNEDEAGLEKGAGDPMTGVLVVREDRARGGKRSTSNCQS